MACPTCGVATERSVTGHESLCLPCTVAELGESMYDLAIRREFGLSVKVYQARLEKFGPPYVSPREWTTPRARLRRK